MIEEPLNILKHVETLWCSLLRYGTQKIVSKQVNLQKVCEKT